MNERREQVGIDEHERVHRLVFDAVAVNSLRKVIALASEAGVTLAPVKGVVLARWLYDQVSDRPYRDLDLLVRRHDFARIEEALGKSGWTLRHRSAEMGELELEVDKIVVEIHGEFGRRDLSRLTTDEVLSRALPDRTTFPFEVMRVDDIDHFLLLVANVTKKTFTYANPHQVPDLERLLARLGPRTAELAARARAAGFLTALRNVAAWMVEEHHSKRFEDLLPLLGGRRRRTLSAAIRWYRRRARRLPNRLSSASGLFGLVLATLTPDERVRQLRGLARLLRRGFYRRLGRDPG